MFVIDTVAPDLVPVLVLPFGALALCCVIGLAIYVGWGRLRRSD